MRFLCCCCGLLALTSLGFAQNQFHLTGSGSAEYRFADSGWLFQSARQLLYKERFALLASLAKGEREPARAQAAGLIMLYAGDQESIDQFIHPLLKLIDNRDPILFYIGNKAVEIYSDYAFYLLPQMVKGGSEMAAYELTRFGEKGAQQLNALAHDKSPKARLAALSYYSDRPTQIELLNDPDPRIVRKAIRNLLSRSSEDPKIIDHLLQDSRPNVRKAAAFLADRWTQRNWPLWIKLAGDPLPEVRRVAMLQMVPLGLDWGKGPWISDGIAAVSRGFHDKSPAVRKAAVMAVRGWLLEWETIAKRWTPAQIAAGEKLIGSDSFYAALQNTVKRRTMTEGSDDQEGIQMANVTKCLAISSQIRVRRAR